MFKNGEGRSRVNNAQQNMSMFDRIGGTTNGLSNKLQQSPGDFNQH